MSNLIFVDFKRRPPGSDLWPVIGPILLSLVLPTLGHGATAQPYPPSSVSPGGSGKKVAVQALPEELFSKDGRVRAAGIELVVKNKMRHAGPKLQSLATSDPGPGVRSFACWAIGELNLTDGIQSLRIVLKTDSARSVRKAAAEALRKLQATARADQAEQTALKPLPKATAQTQVSPTRSNPPAMPDQEPALRCHTHRECRVDHVCVEGICRDVKQTRKSDFSASGDAGHQTSGWALEAGIIGLVGAGAVGGLSVAATLNKEDLLPAIPIAIGASLVTLIVAPSVKTGSKSARKTEGVHGSLSLRVVGWLSFTLHICGSLALGALIPLYFVDEAQGKDGRFPETSWMLANGALGVVSLLTLSVDALIAHGQAKRIIRESAATRSRLSWTPYAAPISSPNGEGGAVIGVAGRFGRID